MTELRPVVLAAVRDEEWRCHVHANLVTWTTLTFVEDARQLCDAALRDEPDVALWHLDGLTATADEYAMAFHALRRVAPRSVVIAYGQMDRAVAPRLLVAGRIGVDRLLFRGFDDLNRGVREVLRATQVDSCIRGVLTRLDIPPGSPALTFAQSLRCARAGPSTVQQLAQALMVNRKTVSAWLRGAGLPAPEQLISWSRVYWVAQLLEDDRRTIADVARELRFSSLPDMRRMVSRHAGCTPRQLRANGGASTVFAAFPTRVCM
jgi:AraC-like DNA-binding protein